VVLDDGSELHCAAVILACGVQYRRLEVPGIDELTGAGVYYGAASTEAASMAGGRVVIVGGANSAGQAALHLSRFADEVESRGPGRVAGRAHVALPRRSGRGDRQHHGARPSSG
jgi:thioredoxin reductase